MVYREISNSIGRNIDYKASKIDYNISLSLHKTCKNQ